MSKIFHTPVQYRDGNTYRTQDMEVTDTAQKPPLIVRLLAAILYIPADLYGIALTPLLILWLIVAESVWLTRLVANLMPGILFPVGVGLVIGLLLRRRFTLTLQIVPLMAVVLLYSPYFIPRNVEVPDGQPLRVMTYNMLFVNEDVDGMVELITEQNADVIAMQEVTGEFREQLETELSDTYPYWAYVQNGNNFYGNIVFSKYEITDELAQFEQSGSLLYLATDVDVAGQIVRVYNIHTAPPRFGNGFDTSSRTEGITTYLTDVRSESPQMPLIIMGDFNMSDQTQDYRRLNRAYTDVYRATSIGFGTTFEYFGSLGFSWIPSYVRLDYVFLRDGVGSPQLVPIASEVIRAGNSDHLPIIVDVVIVD